MSAVSARLPGTSSAPKSSAPASSRRWIVNSWVDGLLILLTPLVAIPAVFMLSSPMFSVKAETIGLIVTAFFATGHHLPGLIRAYGDRELFQRFQWRFILVPPLLFLAYFPLYTYHYELYRLIILVWATWHGLMQLYGFVRIYDAKVGSTSATTARWDWLVCLCGFVMPQFLRPEKLSNALNHWYTLGGPLIPPGVLEAVRWGGLAICGGAALGFTVNYVVQSYRGARPNPLKVLMLISGIGMWWYAILYVENLILGVALFDICHDVQYLAIVWLFNCRRVSSNPQLGGFMRYVFRRGMVLLYLGLITAYGTIGLAGSQLLDGTVNTIFSAVLFTSTILHYYYDGFIWKVRETANQAGLGLNSNGAASRVRQITQGGHAHLLKWSPALLIGGLLFVTDALHPPLTYSRTNELEQQYSKSLTGRTLLPRNEEERSWLYGHFERTQIIAASVPGDRETQLKAAVLLANFGRNPEAVAALEKLLKKSPDYSEAHTTLGTIHLYQGRFEEASSCFQTALSYAATNDARSIANMMFGDLYLHQHDLAAADAKFKEALRDNPKLETAISLLRKNFEAPQTAS